MTKYGKIIIEANSIEEAERELATIKALVNAGAVYGKGSTNENIDIRMGNVPSTPCCVNCPHCCEEEDEYEDDFYGTDDYEDEADYDEKVEAFRMAVQKIIYGK